MHRARGPLLTIGSACLAAALLVCGEGAVLGSPPAPGSPTPTGSAGASSELDCAAPAAPEPVASPTPPPTLDPAVGGARTNRLDVGPARLALCLAGGGRVQVDATCLWNEHRDAILLIHAMRVAAGGRKRSVRVGPDREARPQVGFSVGRRLTHTTWTSGSVVAPSPLSPTGGTRFRAKSIRGGGPAVLAGSLSWTCGAPPARDPGTTDGTLTVSLAGPYAGTFTSRAICEWVDRDGQAAVGMVHNTEDLAPIGDGRHLARVEVTLDRPIREPSVTAVLALFKQQNGRFRRTYADDALALPAARGDGDAAGTVRVLGLRRWGGRRDRRSGDPGLDAKRGAEQALISWSCGTPPPQVTGPSGNARESFSPGRVRLAIAGTEDGSVEVPASCRVADIDGRPLVLHRAATLALGDLQGQLLVLPPDLKLVVLLLTDAAGTYRGEYIARAEDQSGWTDGRDGTGTTVPLTFEPGTLVAPPPLFGATATGPFQATIGWSCEVAAG